MKASTRYFLPVRPAKTALRCLGAAGLSALLAGCLGNPWRDAKVDVRSPIAAEAADATHTSRPDPKFTDIPPVPKDVRPLKQYGVEAAAIEQARNKLEKDTAPGTWTLDNTKAFADSANAAAGPAIAPANPADTEAFAKDLRARATPPPPTQR